jgi:hypothetical protein
VEFYVVYDIETGAFATKGQGPDGSAALQQLEDGFAVMVVPRQAVQTRDPSGIDMNAIRVSYAASVDQDADKIRSMFITNTPGQIATYLAKEAEARAVLAGGSGSTTFLSAEADALGITVAELAAEVVAQADQWRPIGARIEAARRKAKVQLSEAANLTAIHDAVQIDWQAVITGDTPPA